MDPDEFGIFAIVQAALLVVLGCVRSAFFEPMLIYRGEASPSSLRRYVLWIGGIATLGSLASAVVLMLSGQWGWSLVAMIAGLLVLQDGWRYSAFREHLPHKALLLDCIWAAISPAVLLLYISRHGSLDPGAASLAWVVGGAVSAVCGFRLMGTLGGWGFTDPVHEERRRQGPSFASDFILSTGVGFVLVLVLGLVVSAALAGSTRLALASLGVLGIARRGDLTHLLSTGSAQQPREEIVALARASAVRVFLRSLPLSLLLAVLAWPLHRVLLGRTDNDFVTIFAFGAFVNALALAANQLISAWRLLGAAWLVTKRRAAGALVVVTLSSFLAWRFGALGFGIGDITGAVVTVALLWRASRQVREGLP